MADDQIKAELDYFFAEEALLEQVVTGFHFSELPSGLSVVQDVPAEIAAAPAALAQWMSLSDADSVDVQNYITTHYGVAPTSAQQTVENILKALVQAHGLFGIYNSLVALFKPAAPVVPVAPVVSAKP